MNETENVVNYLSTALAEQLRDLWPCPFCGADVNLHQETRYIHTVQRSRGVFFYFLVCPWCGAQSGMSVDPQGAINNWNRRPSYSWSPLGPHRFLLPEGQTYQHLLVHEGGQYVVLLDYSEGITTAMVDIDLGPRFRIARKEPVDGKKE